MDGISSSNHNKEKWVPKFASHVQYAFCLDWVREKVLFHQTEDTSSHWLLLHGEQMEEHNPAGTKEQEVHAVHYSLNIEDRERWGYGTHYGDS